MRIDVPLGFPLGKGRSTAAGMQGLCNMYAEPIQADGKVRMALYTTPGRVAFSTIGGGTVRGQINTSAAHYAVVGTSLYQVGSTGTATSVGEIEGSDPVDMSYNGQQIVIVAELKSYSFDVPSLVLSEITDGDFVQASSTAALASYSLVARKNTGQFAWSSLIDATAWDPLDFVTAEGEPDNIVALRRRGNEIIPLGTNSVEVWGLTGDASAPFQRVSTSAVTIGCVARDSAVLVDNGLVWVGRDGLAGGVSVYRMEGYTPKKISGPNEDVLLESVSDPTTLHAFAYQQAGHQFYVLTSPQEWTIAWDVLTGNWAYRRTGEFTMGAEPLGGWNCRTFALNGSKQIVGSDDGNLYQLDLDTLTDAGSMLVRETTTPQLYAGGSFRTINQLNLEIESGVGLISGQGSDPIVLMSYSKDSGKTWSTPRGSSMGRMGQYKYRASWTRLGRAKDIMFKFRTTDPVTTVYLSAWADIS